MTREQALNKYADKIKTNDELILYCAIVNDIYDSHEQQQLEAQNKIIELREQLKKQKSYYEVKLMEARK